MTDEIGFVTYEVVVLPRTLGPRTKASLAALSLTEKLPDGVQKATKFEYSPACPRCAPAHSCPHRG